MKGKKRGPYDPEKVKKRGEHRRGIKHTKEAREKMSKAKLGKKRGPRKKKTIEKIRRSNIEVAKNRDFSYLQDDDYKKEQSRKMKEIWRLRKEGKLPMPQRKSKE